MAETAGIKNPDQEQHHAAPDDAANRSAAADRFDGSAEGEHQGRTDDENEEGKDQVVESESFPVFVIQLFRENRDDTGMADFVEPMEQVLRADDPKHVETAQGIEGHQSLGDRGTGRGWFFVGHGMA